MNSKPSSQKRLGREDVASADPFVRLLAKAAATRPEAAALTLHPHQLLPAGHRGGREVLGGGRRGPRAGQTPSVGVAGLLGPSCNAKGWCSWSPAAQPAMPGGAAPTCCARGASPNPPCPGGQPQPAMPGGPGPTHCAWGSSPNPPCPVPARPSGADGGAEPHGRGGWPSLSRKERGGEALTCTAF